MQRYTPRNPKSLWSSSNIARAKKMISQKKMLKVGRDIYEHGMKNKQFAGATPKRIIVPNDIKTALRNDKEAFKNFNNFSKSTRFMYLSWIKSAKRDETKEKRIAELVIRSKNNLKPGE